MPSDVSDSDVNVSDVSVSDVNVSDVSVSDVNVSVSDVSVSDVSVSVSELPDGATGHEQTVVALGDVPTTDQRGYFGQQLGFEESRDGCRFKGVAVGVGG